MSVDRVDCSCALQQALSDPPAWDCHMHTLHDDGQGDLGSMVAAALRAGLQRIVFTVHTEAPAGRPADWFQRFRAELNAAKAEYDGRLQILLGLEVPAASNSLGIFATDEMLAEAEFVVGSAHRYPRVPANSRTRDLCPDDLRKLEVETLLMLCENPHIDTIGHVGGTCALFGAPLHPDDFLRILRVAATRGRAVEINARHHSPLDDFLPLFRQAGVRVTLGSDAHRPEDVGRIIRLLRDLGGRPADE